MGNGVNLYRMECLSVFHRLSRCLERYTTLKAPLLYPTLRL